MIFCLKKLFALRFTFHNRNDAIDPENRNHQILEPIEPIPKYCFSAL